MWKNINFCPISYIYLINKKQVPDSIYFQIHLNTKLPFSLSADKSSQKEILISYDSPGILLGTITWDIIFKTIILLNGKLRPWWIICLNLFCEWATKNPPKLFPASKCSWWTQISPCVPEIVGWKLRWLSFQQRRKVSFHKSALVLEKV